MKEKQRSQEAVNKQQQLHEQAKKEDSQHQAKTETAVASTNNPGSQPVETLRDSETNDNVEAMQDDGHETADQDAISQSEISANGTNGRPNPNDQLLSSLLKEFPIPDKAPDAIRFSSFNINGFKTLLNYHPWSKLLGLQGLFQFLRADVVSLQELKTSKEHVNNAVAKIDGFHTFISLPAQKKGYAGVGVYVRKPTPRDLPYVAELLTVKKAEEGISGYLRCHDYKLGIKTYKDIHDISRRTANSSTTDTGAYKQFVKRHVIGGYANVFDRERCLQLDSQGRCIVVELGHGVVVFGVYCPANSLGTEEGERFRLDYLKLLFSRMRSLEKMGKRVVVMGDINVARDLIDSGELIQRLYEEGRIRKVEANGNSVDRTVATEIDVPGAEFEALNRDQVVKFATSSAPRVYLNSVVHGSFIQDAKTAIDESNNILQNDAQGNPVQVERIKDLFVNSDDDETSDLDDDDGYSDHKKKIPIREIVDNNPFLHDLIRESQGRRLKMYTCWNTLKNYRAINFGSRIDLMLACDGFRKFFIKGGILPHLNGSDHCPVYCDFTVTGDIEMELVDEKDNPVRSLSPVLATDEPYVPRLESRFVFGLNDATIMNMFKNFNKYSILGKRKANDNENGNKNGDRNGESNSALALSGTPNDGDLQEIKVVAKKPKLLEPETKPKSNGEEFVYVSRKKAKNKGQKTISSFFKPANKPKPKADQEIESVSSTPSSMGAATSNDALFEEVKKGIISTTETNSTETNSTETNSSQGSGSDSGNNGQRGGSASPYFAKTRPKSGNLLDILSSKFAKPPLCHHREECLLRTSMTEKTKGKKFWCCRKVPIRNNTDVLKRSSGLDQDISCGYFKWA